MTTTIKLKKEVWFEARSKAMKEGKSGSAVIQEQLEKYIAGDDGHVLPPDVYSKAEEIACKNGLSVDDVIRDALSLMGEGGVI